MSINKTVIMLLAAFALAWPGAAYADNDTEFGIEDDLTVLGTAGTAADPDLEVKGFSVFGATQAAPPLEIPVAAGNIFVNGYVQVSSGLYVNASSTFTGHGIFQSTVTMVEGNLKYGAGASGKVLKSQGDGYVYWGDDSTGAAALAGTAYRIRMEDGTGTTLADSLLQQNSGGTNITLIGDSSMTITGQLGVAGYSLFQSTVQFTGNVGEVTNLYFDNAAANAGRVLKASSNGFLYWGSDATGLATLGTARRLQMVNDTGTGLINSMFIQNAGDTNLTVITGSSLTVNDLLALNDVDLNAKLNVDGDATFISSLTARGDSQLGDDSAADVHAINAAPVAGTALKIEGGVTSGNYVATFYSGASLAAWIKKK